MKTSASWYHNRPLTGPALTFADRVRTWSDTELEAYCDAYYSEWARYAAAGSESSAAYLRANLEDVAAEQGRRISARERHVDDPLAPRWTESKQREYERLRRLTDYLRNRWPIERFMTELMAVDLRDVGTAHIGRCPFPDHHDTAPSFRVYLEDNHWHCFGCNRHGDVFDLVGMHFGLDSFRSQIDKLTDATPDVPDKLRQPPPRPRLARKRKGFRLQGGKLVAA